MRKIFLGLSKEIVKIDCEIFGVEQSMDPIKINLSDNMKTQKFNK